MPRSATGIDFLKRVCLVLTNFDELVEGDAGTFLETNTKSWNIKSKHYKTDSNHSYPIVYSIFYISLNKEIKKKRDEKMVHPKKFSWSANTIF